MMFLAFFILRGHHSILWFYGRLADGLIAVFLWFNIGLMMTE